MRRLGILGDMRGDAHLAEQVHEAFRVVVFVSGDRHATGVWQIAHHRAGRVAFRRPRRMGDERVDDQAVSILREHMPEVRQLGFLPRGFLVQAGVRIVVD